MRKSLLAKAALVVALGAIGLVSSPEKARASMGNCGGCVGTFCGTQAAALYCAMACGGVGAGAYCEYNGCGPGQDYIDCGAES